MARLVKYLKAAYPDLQIWGSGSEHMNEAGVELLYDCQSTAVLGFFEIIRHLPFFLGLRTKVIKELKERKPDLALFVDYAGFNLNIAPKVRKFLKDTPFYYFISPQVWGSRRPWRMQTIKRSMSKMLVIFPFEEAIYKEQGVEAKFVGHPLKQSLPEVDEERRKEFCSKYGFDPDKPLIGIFPGSRKKEVRDFLPMILEAIDWLSQENKDLQFAISQATIKVETIMSKVIARSKYKNVLGQNVKIIAPEDSQILKGSSILVWAKSGTTTLETAIYEKPMLVFYKGNFLTYLLFLVFKSIRFISLPNVLANEYIVPELLMFDCRPELFVRYTLDWLSTPGYMKYLEGELSQVKGQLGEGDFIKNTTREIAQALDLDLRKLDEILTKDS